MKLKKALENLGAVKANKVAKKLSLELNLDWADGLKFVFSAMVNDLERVPGNIGGVHDDEKTAIKKWLVKYNNGYEGRATCRISNPPGTVSDPIIDKIIGARLTKLTKDDLNKISYAHRLGMSAENILGLILEDYLSINLKDAGWHCAWGETIKSVDFIHKDGRLLQIKNRSNSENSSSSAVRKGTVIEKWYRIKANKIEYMWESLNEICNTTVLSEKSFIKFVSKCIKKNPECLAVEENNPWDVKETI